MMRNTNTVGAAMDTVAQVSQTGTERKLAVFRTVLDGFRLPFRRPMLFLPFFLTGLASFVLMTITVFGAVAGGVGALFSPTKDLLQGMSLVVLLGLLSVAAILELGVEATSELAARAELGHDLELGEAFGKAFRRLPAFFVAILPVALAFWLLSSLQTVLSEWGMPPGIMGIVLQLLGIFFGVRFALVPAAIVVGNASPLKAFPISWQLTQGSWWRLFFIVLLAGLGIFVLFFALMFIPILGWFAAWWLAFAGMTTVLTLAYLRLGGELYTREGLAS